MVVGSFCQLEVRGVYIYVCVCGMVRSGGRVDGCVGIIMVYEENTSVGGGGYSHEDDGAHDNDPSEGAYGSVAGLADQGGDDEVDGGDPEEDLDGVDDGVGLEGLPPLEDPDVFGEELVGDEDERLGTLYISK